MGKTKKTIFISLLLALICECALFYIIYFNPNKMSPILDPSLQMSLSGAFNFISAILLFIAYLKIKNKKIKAHIVFIHLALLSSAAFLINYIFYHLTVGHVTFTHPSLRPYYLFILITHLLASVTALPLIFITYSLAITKDYSAHKKTAKMTFLLWEYVSVSGVLLILFLKFIHQV